jgi:hypothetical protein
MSAADDQRNGGGFHAGNHFCNGKPGFYIAAHGVEQDQKPLNAAVLFNCHQCRENMLILRGLGILRQDVVPFYLSDYRETVNQMLCILRADRAGLFNQLCLIQLFFCAGTVGVVFFLCCHRGKAPFLEKPVMQSIVFHRIPQIRETMQQRHRLQHTSILYHKSVKSQGKSGDFPEFHFLLEMLLPKGKMGAKAPRKSDDFGKRRPISPFIFLPGVSFSLPVPFCAFSFCGRSRRSCPAFVPAKSILRGRMPKGRIAANSACPCCPERLLPH